jgi:large subunit ribosomal protein L15
MDVAKVTGVDVGRRRKVRVGRGSGSGLGKTSGRGFNGAASKSGFGGLLWREGGQMPLIRRLPKRGFRNTNFRVAYHVVNVDRLAAFAGKKVDPDFLKEAGLLPRTSKRVKILATGDVTAKLEVHAHAFSAEARKKIEDAGGSATVIEVRTGVGPKPREKRVSPRAAARAAKLAARPAKPAKAEGKGEGKADAKTEERPAGKPKA